MFAFSLQFFDNTFEWVTRKDGTIGLISEQNIGKTLDIQWWNLFFPIEIPLQIESHTFCLFQCKISFIQK